MVRNRPVANILQWTALLAALALLGATDLTTNLDQRVLSAQNRERSAAGIEPLVWDDRLAAAAQSWATHLAQTQAFQHAPDDDRDPQGENIWGGTRGHYSAEAMVDGWVREKRYFKAGAFPDNSTTGNVADVGHYTQLMWRDTRRVGCALARGAREDILVCRYSAAGNYIGEQPF